MSEYKLVCDIALDNERFRVWGFAGDVTPEKREEIVRCRDCKYLVDDDSVWVCDSFCANIGFNDGTPPDGFCSWGERRSEWPSI